MTEVESLLFRSHVTSGWHSLKHGCVYLLDLTEIFQAEPLVTWNRNKTGSTP